MPREVGCFTGNGSLVTWTPDSQDADVQAAATLFGEAPPRGTGPTTFEVQTLPQPRLDDGPGDLQRRCVTEPIETGEFTVQIYFSPDMDLTKLVGQRGTITRIHPTPDGMSAGARWSGKGYVRAATIPDEQPGAYSIADVTFQWEGQNQAGDEKLEHSAANGPTGEQLTPEPNLANAA